MEHTLPYCSFAARQERRGTPFLLIYAGACETLCEMELYEQFKQSAQALELLHERKMWNGSSWRGSRLNVHAIP